MAAPETGELPRSADFDAAPGDFNAVAWVNAALATHEAGALRELCHEGVRQAHGALDEGLSRAVAAVPWVVRETEKVRQRANNLRANVDGVGERVAGVEHGVAGSVATIAASDTIVRRVQRACELLVNAGEAERLLRRLEALLASSASDGSDLVTAADVVAQLRTALAPLSAIPEMEDRFNSLNTADAKLEALAAPQLQKALETRNTAAAANARIVFDRAGRANAFCTQYVTIRAAQIGKIWSSSWDASQTTASDFAVEADDSDTKQRPPRASAGDLAAPGSVAALSAFFGAVQQLLQIEADWLTVAFPDLRATLLPSLVCTALTDFKSPALVSNVFFGKASDESSETAGELGDRMNEVALCSIRAAAAVAKILLPPTASETTALDTAAADDAALDGLSVVVLDAVSTVLFPYRIFWDTLCDVAARQAKSSAMSLPLPCALVKPATSAATQSAHSSSPPRHTAGPASVTAGTRRYRPPLSEIAKDVEGCCPSVLAALDTCLSQMTERTAGVGMTAMNQAASTTAAVLSDRLVKILRLPLATNRVGVPPSANEDEWVRISGALRLLRAVSKLKRSWDARRESAFAVAIGTATPVLEGASLIADNAHSRIERLLSQVDAGNLTDAGVVWELVRDSDLAGRVIAAYEDSTAGNGDLSTLIEAVHGVVYESMFNGVWERFASFGARERWSSDGGDGDSSMLGFSSSPLGYATEVADYLMTIPQQLEPFVPEEDYAEYATPTSAYAFSLNANTRSKGSARAEPADPAPVGDTTAGESGADVEDTMVNLSFAGMWISVLAVGTMEFYVEKMCGITKLSAAGTRQLATDAEYICNVLAALGVVPTPDMDIARRVLECPADTGSFRKIGDSVGVAEQKLVRRLAAVRGYSL